MLELQRQNIVQRMIGAARLDPDTYEAVERDEQATSSALLVVVLAAIATGIGNLGAGGVVGLIGGIAVGLLAWALYAGVAYFIGTRFLATTATRSTWGELLRTLGFAQAPKLLLVLAVIPVVGGIVAVVVGIWVLATTVVAIRHALDFNTGRAILTAVIAWIVYIIPNLIVAAIFT